MTLEVYTIMSDIDNHFPKAGECRTRGHRFKVRREKEISEVSYSTQVDG